MKIGIQDATTRQSITPEPHLKENDMEKEKMKELWAEFLGLKNSKGVYLYNEKLFLLPIDKIPAGYSENRMPMYRAMTRAERKHVIKSVAKHIMENKKKEAVKKKKAVQTSMFTEAEQGTEPVKESKKTIHDCH